MNGNTIIISAINGSTEIIAAAKSGEIQTDCETIEVASATQRDWRNFIAGRKTWSVNVNYLVINEAALSKVLAVGTTYSLTIKKRGSSSNISGTATLVTCKQTYTRGNLCVGSFVFKGTGPLS